LNNNNNNNIEREPDYEEIDRIAPPVVREAWGMMGAPVPPGPGRASLPRNLPPPPAAPRGGPRPLSWGGERVNANVNVGLPGFAAAAAASPPPDVTSPTSPMSALSRETSFSSASQQVCRALISRPMHARCVQTIILMRASILLILMSKTARICTTFLWKDTISTLLLLLLPSRVPFTAPHRSHARVSTSHRHCGVYRSADCA